MSIVDLSLIPEKVITMFIRLMVVRYCSSSRKSLSALYPAEVVLVQAVLNFNKVLRF
jgi:hypothetical protein